MDRTTSNTTKIQVTLLPLFGGGNILNNATSSEIVSALNEDIWAHFYLSMLLFLAVVLIMSGTVYTINFVALKQTMRIKKILLHSVLSQDITWFDCKKNLDFTSKINGNLDLIKDAIGEKLITACYMLSIFFFQIIICTMTGWLLTLTVGGSYMILLIVSSILIGKSEKRLAKRELEGYSKAGSIAEEVFKSIQTVIAYNGEEKESLRYSESIKIAEKFSIKKNFFSGLQSGIMFFLAYTVLGLAFFIGIYLMVQDFHLPEAQRTYYSVSIETIVFALASGAQHLTVTVPSFEAITSAISVASHICEIIDQASTINPFSIDGMVKDLNGDIEFKNVHFQYPSRKNVKVLKGISLAIKRGESVALIGRSGSGKSTIFQLLQRFYDTNKGEILLDGTDIKEINTAYLRSQISVVHQEPVLFSGTIAENIRFGNPQATQKEIEKAAKIANCNDFIEKLPKGYDTIVGENGAQLSGGQKQRIAIARAVIKNPKILLLDEATSAMDTQSERIIQKSLGNAMKGRTTLIISHRLSAIRNANQIVVVNQGEIVEKGTHEVLMNRKGIYYEFFIESQEDISQDLNGGVILAEYLKAFETVNIDDIYNIATYCTVEYIALAVTIGCAALIQTYVFGKVAVRLSSLLRIRWFETAIRQELVWYDEQGNNAGALTARLSSDCDKVQRATGIQLSLILQMTSSAIVSIIIGLLMNWKLALLCSMIFPIIVIVGILESKYANINSVKKNETLENASKIAVEAIRNIRTVASFGQEHHFLQKFNQEIDIAEAELRNRTKYRGLVYSLNSTISFLCYGALFLYIGPLVTSGEIFPTSIDYNCVKFRYPSRPEMEVLKGITFKVAERKTVALVGPSGSGKSTCVQLLLRFYDLLDGSLDVHGRSIFDFSLYDLRSQFGYVSQEPILFDYTIAENIAYGDNSRKVPIDEIIEAAKDAQIHSEFISKLPLGYDTPVGSRGDHLSGGQKQRIALARALIRKPKVIILDEATSALDPDSEKLIQRALSKASKDRTCIVITHKLSSVRHADLICVIDRGVITEIGTHSDLVSYGGTYSKLYQSFK
ncbi:multidrug resistance protein homolog 49-like [Phlebotomus papatasi]|uniref:multidrug resistance protein homolog 49-like n=1 Tax=Phlebotomus papatasi TaxID=29031 RepID=UPI002483D725|nr:multidrug resistance protein homolog 49-like [Phlebotomus papatasi]